MMLGAKNVTDNPVLSKNLRLFAGIIAIVAFMSSIFASLSFDLHDAYKTKYLYDVTMEMKESKEDETNRLLAIDGVTGVTPYSSDYETLETNKNIFLNSLFGIKDIDFFDYYAAEGVDTCREAINHLNDGNNIITTEIMHSKFGYNLGDKMILQRNNKEMTFTITGFVDTNNGIGLGILTAQIMMRSIPGLVGLMWGKVVIHPANMVILILSLSGILIMLAISIISLKLSSKISILENLRCE